MNTKACLACVILQCNTVRLAVRLQVISTEDSFVAVCSKVSRVFEELLY
jgi:hypothetical protein